MTTTRRRAPTMFQRRLGLLMACGVGACVLMLGQLIRLAIIEGPTRLAQAEARLESADWIPTWRGTIYDRNGLVLARDEPGYEVAVAWGGITGSWAQRAAINEARRVIGRAGWEARSPEEREALVAQALPQWQDVLESLWELIAVVTNQEADRLERDLDAQRARVQHMAAVVWERQRQRHEARYGSSDVFNARPIAEQRDFHVVVPHIDDADAMPLQRFAQDWPDLLRVRYARHRDHPLAGLAAELDHRAMPRLLRTQSITHPRIEQVGQQLIGDVRYDVWAEDLSRRPFIDAASGTVDRGGYRRSDRVGARGIERGWEDTLRGEVGLVRTSRRSNEKTREPPRPGEDVTLTIDADLQARVEAILDADTGLTRVQPWHGNHKLPQGTPLAAAAVVLDIATGEILAMASTPSPSAADEMDPLDLKQRSPWINRAIEAAYPPGSIIKPLVMAAAMMEGEVTTETIIECRGHHFPDRKDVARCWIYRPRFGLAVHGGLSSREALARSCNSYFYELGHRLGLETLADWFTWFGLGQSFDIGFDGPAATGLTMARGHVPDPEARRALRERGEAVFESVMMGIGQGQLTWTPLHAADAYATLARGGRRLVPTLIRGHRSLTPAGDDRLLSPEALAAILDGLRLGVSEPWATGSRIKYGTGDYEPIFTSAGVMGKTGTAQAPPWPRDVDGDGVISPGESVSGLEHAWFVGLVGAQTGPPQFAIAVIVEFGGSGGRVAGPVANQIIEALKQTGYLQQVPSVVGVNR